MSEILDALIVGSGFSGLGMAIRLRQAGIDNFIVIEKSGELGGTWYENQYPGCACDVPSHLYSFSFDPNPNWTRMYASQGEIREYLQGCSKRFGVDPHLRFHTRLIEAVWDESERVWRSTLSDGTRITSRALISGMGALHIPHYPELPGIERFAGPAFHSAEWRHDVALDGKSVAVVGTGASAIQFVPRVAQQVGRLTLFQRTPAWILPRADFGIAPQWRERFRRHPALMRIFRQCIFWVHELQVFSFLGNRTLRRFGELMARRHLASQVADPALRASLTPKYELGCKRVLSSNDFYPALARPNVELVTEGIREVREHAVVTVSGREVPADVIVYGTGFRVTEPFRGTRIVGKGGVEIHERWKERASAYLGICVAGFPNLFLLLGPNTGLGHNSVVLMIEAQIGYVMSALDLMNSRRTRTIEVRAERQSEWDAEMVRRLSGTVWQSGGCRSWYQDQRTGENPVLWPGTVLEYVRRTRNAAEQDYAVA